MLLHCFVTGTTSCQMRYEWIIWKEGRDFISVCIVVRWDAKESQDYRLCGVLIANHGRRGYPFYNQVFSLTPTTCQLSSQKLFVITSLISIYTVLWDIGTLVHGYEQPLTLLNLINVNAFCLFKSRYSFRRLSPKQESIVWIGGAITKLLTAQSRRLG